MPPNIRFPATNQRAQVPRQSVPPKISEREEPTNELRLYFSHDWKNVHGPDFKGRLQQRWIISQVQAQNNARSRPVEVRAEWRDVVSFIDQPPPPIPDLKAEKARFEALQTQAESDK